MNSPQKHLRNTFLAGIFAAIPLAITIFIIWYIDAQTRALTEYALHRRTPFVGILLAIAIVYLLGLATTSLIGRFFLMLVDRLLQHVPVLRDVYRAWKQISLTPGGTEGMFSKVALVPGEAGRLLAFTSGRPLPGDPTSTCVFVPNAPNPTTGRLYFVKLVECNFVEVSTEEAFKMLLSGGNYISENVLPDAKTQRAL